MRIGQVGEGWPASSLGDSPVDGTQSLGTVTLNSPFHRPAIAVDTGHRLSAYVKAGSKSAHTGKSVWGQNSPWKSLNTAHHWTPRTTSSKCCSSLRRVPPILFLQ